MPFHFWKSFYDNGKPVLYLILCLIMQKKISKLYQQPSSILELIWSWQNVNICPNSCVYSEQNVERVHTAWNVMLRFLLAQWAFRRISYEKKM